MREKRIGEIVEFVNQNGLCSYEDVCDRFSVSMSTARRDINRLVDAGLVQKVHGGISSFDYTSLNKDKGLLAFAPGRRHHAGFFKVLDHIGQIAASNVHDGDIIFISSGTTALHMLPHLKYKKDLTIITNNLLIAVNDMDYNNDILLIGGLINYKAQTTSGSNVTETLASLSISKAFMSCNGISLTKGFTNLEDREVYIKKTVIQNSHSVYMLADSSKLGKPSLYTFASYADIDYFFTDKEPPPEYSAILRQNNVKVLY